MISIEFSCELNLSLHAIHEMIVDSISEDDVKETLIMGNKTENDKGSGYVYTYGVLCVISENEPCHYYVITAFKDTSEKPSYKDKAYRRRRFMRRRASEKPCFRCGKDNLRYGTYHMEISGKDMGRFEGYQCPNCKLTFFSEESSYKIRKILEEFKVEPLTPAEISLILLGATEQPIRGAISFMKEAFLLFKEKFAEHKVPVISPQFISYHYGPYSFELVEAWRTLEEEELIERKGRASSNKESFSLTAKGKVESQRLMTKLPKALKEELPRWRRGLDELGNDGILKDVYLKYPEYTDKSKIKNKVLPHGIRRRA